MSPRNPIVPRGPATPPESTSQSPLSPFFSIFKEAGQLDSLPERERPKAADTLLKQFLERLGLGLLEGWSFLTQAGFDALCWEKYNKSAERLIRDIGRGDARAIAQFTKIYAIYLRMFVGKLRANELKFKTKSDHHTLMRAILADNTKELTGNELVETFDQNCPCAKEHSMEALGELRKRLRRIMRREARDQQISPAFLFPVPRPLEQLTVRTRLLRTIIGALSEGGYRGDEVAHAVDIIDQQFADQLKHVFKHNSLAFVIDPSVAGLPQRKVRKFAREFVAYFEEEAKE